MTVILVWRTYAIWGHSKKIMYGVGTAWAVCRPCSYAIVLLIALQVLVLCNVPILTIFTRSLDCMGQLLMPPLSALMRLAVDYPPLPQIPGCYLVNASDIAFGSFASLLIMELSAYSAERQLGQLSDKLFRYSHCRPDGVQGHSRRYVKAFLPFKDVINNAA